MQRTFTSQLPEVIIVLSEYYEVTNAIDLLAILRNLNPLEVVIEHNITGKYYFAGELINIIKEEMNIFLAHRKLTSQPLNLN